MASSTLEPLFKLRKASISDAAAISILGRRVFTLSFGNAVQPHELTDYLNDSYSVSAIEKDLLDTNKTTIVATHQGQVIGFSMLARGTTDPCLEKIANKIELQRLYIDTEHQGKGVGKQLLEQSFDVAREEKFESIWLGVWENGHVAQAVYKKAGFEGVGNHDFHIGGATHRDIIMLKRL